MLVSARALKLFLVPSALALAPALVCAASPAAPASLLVSTHLTATAIEDLTVDDRRRLREAGDALEASQPSNALEIAELALEYSPSSVLLLDVASRAAAALGDRDLALHYSRLALLQPAADEDKTLAAVVKGLRARMLELDPDHSQVQVLLDAYGETLFDLGKSAKRRKLWANAVDFLQHCEGTAIDPKAKKELAKIFKSDEAIEALVASGLDIEFENASIRKSPEAIAKLDAKHRNWENRLSVDTKGGYTIECNRGYLFTHAVALAMDQVNLFLRDMYQHKTRGQRMRGSKIQVYFDRDEFQAYEDVGPNVGGYFSPSENRIVSYDYGGLTASLNTLFHEVSHQFMRDVTKNMVPGWISEGVACYFEGTDLLPNGKVVANLIPERRLNGVTRMIKTGSVDVMDVITYFQPGSYDGSYYPYGWGLVYFMRNFEDENAVRVYRPHFDDFVATYKSGGKHSVFGRFEEYFIERPAQPDVTSYGEFIVKWEAWILDLHDLHHGGAEMADRLLDRGDLQVSKGFPLNAADSYRWALEKRAKDVRALYGLARTSQTMKVDDVALYYFRQVLDWTLSQGDQEAIVRGLDRTVADLALEAREGIKEVNADVATGMLAASDLLAESLIALATAYRDNEYPRRSLALLDQTRGLVGPRAELLQLYDTIRDQSGLDMRQKRRLRIDGALEFWSSNGDGKWSADGDDMKGENMGDRLAYTTYAEMPPDKYRFEATIDLLEIGENPVLGIYFGSGLGVRQMIAFSRNDGGIIQLEVGLGGPKRVGERLEKVRLLKGDTFELVIEVEDGEIKVFFDGAELKDVEIAAKDLPGQLGLFVQSASVRFSGLRMVF